MWTNFNLLTQGRTIQIYGPSNWKFRIPFGGDENTLRHEDIFKDTPRGRNLMAFNLDERQRILEANELLEECDVDLEDDEGIIFNQMDDEEHFTDSQNEDTD